MPRIGIPSRRRASTWALPTNPTPITAAVWFIDLAPGIALTLGSSPRNGAREAVCAAEYAGGKVSVFGLFGNSGPPAAVALSSHHLPLTFRIPPRVRQRLRLEAQLQSQLNDSRVAVRVGDCAKGRIAEVRVGILEQRMVEDVEKLGAELEVSAVSDLVDRELLEKGEVKVELARAAENANAGVAVTGSDAIVPDDGRS